MGNRVLIQFVNGKDVSPAIYGHWSGSRAAETIVALREQMADRPGDLSYVAARCVGRLILGGGVGEHNGSTGFGLWNAPKPLTAEDSHGDAGIFLVDISKPKWRVSLIAGHISERGAIKASRLVTFAEEA